MNKPIIALVAAVAVLGVPRLAVAAPQCTSIDEFNNLAAAQAAFTSSITLEFDVTGLNPSDYTNDKAWLAEFVNTSCTNPVWNGFGGFASLKIYGPGNPTHASGSIKYEYNWQCVCPNNVCNDNWADVDFSQPIFTDPAQQCHVKLGVDDLKVSYSIQCDGGTTYAGEGDNATIGLKINKASILNKVAASVTVSNVQVCFELGPSSTNTKTLLAVEDATVLESAPDAVQPADDLACGLTDGKVYLKFEVPDPIGTVKSAKLTLTAPGDGSADGQGGDLYFVPDNNWSEDTLTWNNAPATTGAAIGQIVGVVENGVYSVDVASRVNGCKGQYAFALVPRSDSSNGAHFISKEVSSTLGPRLLIAYDTTSMPTCGAGGAAGAAGWGGAQQDASTAGTAGVAGNPGLGGNGGDVGKGGSGGGGYAYGEDDGGCGCRSSGRTGPFGIGAILGMAAVWLARKRRRE